MAETSELDRIIDEVCAAAGVCGSFLVKAALAVEANTVPAVAVDCGTFPALIRHVKPRIVYVLASPFDAGEEVLATFDEQDHDLLEQPHIKKLVARWRSRDGQTARIALALMCDGVLHGIVEEAAWLETFEAEAKVLAGDVERSREERERKAETAEKLRIAPHVKQLMTDPRFTAPKVGNAKRTALAETLFPELDRGMIRAVVDRAESEHWLATSGRSL